MNLATRDGGDPTRSLPTRAGSNATSPVTSTIRVAGSAPGGATFAPAASRWPRAPRSPTTTATTPPALLATATDCRHPGPGIAKIRETTAPPDDAASETTRRSSPSGPEPSSHGVRNDVSTPYSGEAAITL